MDAVEDLHDLSLFPPEVQVFGHTLPWPAVPASPYCEELSVVAKAVPRRREEFFAGRACARSALVALGYEGQAIRSDEEGTGMARWPAGTLGAISHCDGYVLAAVARRGGGAAGLGVDVEANLPIEPSLARLVDQQLRDQPRFADGAERSRLLFSIKESVFKACFAVDRAWLEFSDVSVEVGQDGSYSARAWSSGKIRSLAGRWVLSDMRLFTSAVLDSAPEPY
jgi:4'-phosphopantetheinyl transferase EntD